MPDRQPLQDEYLQLVSERLPYVARRNSGWPVRLDHCFARIILDHVCGGPWRDFLKPPAYRNLSETQLQTAVELGNSIIVGTVDLVALNSQSLRWRGKLQ